MENKRLYQKLKEYFNDNIRLSFVTKNEVIIITKEDKFYKFDRNSALNENKILLIAFSENESTVNSLIEKSIIEKLCNRQIIDVSKCFRHLILRTNDKKVYQFYQYTNNNDRVFNRWLKTPIINKDRSELNQFPTDGCVSDICCGYNHCLALTTSGQVFAWVDNSTRYQVGSIGLIKIIGNMSEPSLLYKPDGEKAKAISCGSMHSLILTEKGRVFKWGHNYYEKSSSGILRYWNKLPSLLPFPIQINDIIEKISCGRNHNLLLSKDGQIYSFGDNSYGQLGTGDYESHCHPQKLFQKYQEKFIDIVSHCDHNISAALSIYGEYYVWGECGKQNMNIRKLTEFKSFHHIFAHYCDITHKQNENTIIPFNDNFIKYGIFEKRFEKLKELGEGSYGQVFKVEDRVSNKFYAVKVMRLEKSKEKEFLKELESSSILNLLYNEKVVQYYDVWLENHVNDKKVDFTLYIQMELCDKSLEDVIDEIDKDSNLKVNDSLTLMGFYIASQIFVQMLEGVQYLHELKPQIIHRDLKPDNILLNIESYNKIFVKIADLGLVAFHKYVQHADDKTDVIEHEYANDLHTTDVGAIKYAAPEVLKSEEYDTKADIYSLGTILEQLFDIDFDRFTNENDSEISLLMNKYREATDICGKMIKPEPNERPTCKELLQDKHLWALNENEFDIQREIGNLFYYNKNSSFFSKPKGEEVTTKTSIYPGSPWSPEDSEYFPDIKDDIDPKDIKPNRFSTIFDVTDGGFTFLKGQYCVIKPH